MGFEVHVKDETRFAGKWAFFSFDSRMETARSFPRVRLLHLPHRPCRGRHDICAVLPDAIADCTGQGYIQQGISQGRSSAQRQPGAEVTIGLLNPSQQKEGSMIRRCGERDFEPIWAIVNNAAQAYKGIIPRIAGRSLICPWRNCAMRSTMVLSSGAGRRPEFWKA